MKATDRLVLAKDVVIATVESFAPDLRERLDATIGDWVVTRRSSRARSIVIDAGAAAFLEQFRMPTGVVDAVLRHAAATGEDPEQLLDGAAPLLLRMRQRHFVAVDGEAQAAVVEPSLQPGQRAGGVEIICCVHLFDNVEIYRVRRVDGEEAALKILRGEPSIDSLRMIERESVILTHLNGSPAPRLIEQGLIEGRPHLVESWCEGVNVTRAAALRRRGTTVSVGAELLALCVKILRAYVALHGRGVVHGDVHPGNVHVSDAGIVTLLDFGLSRCEACDRDLPAPRRGGLFEYFEPEYCSALMRHEPPPAATFLSDQYALGSLLYSLLADAHCQQFSLDLERWLAQVAKGKPLSFAEHGLEPWPDLEAVLTRALDRNPSCRFASVAEFLAAFESVTSAQQLRGQVCQPGGEFLTGVIGRFALGDALSVGNALKRIRAPRCSINYGAAGIAYFLYRVASLRGDPRLLAGADVWCIRARQHAADDEAFHSTEIGITADVTGLISPFHRESGLHLVQALISRAIGDLASANRAARAFVEAGGAPCENPDLTLGSASVLLGCANLAEALPHNPSIDRLPVLELGHRIALDLVAFMTGRAVGDVRHMQWLGVAHGWAGILYALLRWTQANGAEFSSVAHDRLHELAALGRREGAQITWLLGLGEDARARATLTGWCHGSAGYLMLWTLAHRVLGGDSFLELARGSASHLTVSSLRPAGNINASLCCGYAGQGFAMLAFHRHTGDPAQLRVATDLCQRAVELAPGALRPDSLYHGDVGVALLVEELAHPANSCMPLLEAEGWAQSVV